MCTQYRNKGLRDQTSKPTRGTNTKPQLQRNKIVTRLYKTATDCILKEKTNFKTEPVSDKQFSK